MKKILVIIFLLISTNAFSVENQRLNFTIEIFEEAKKNDSFDSQTLSEVREFLEQPRKWQEKRCK